MMENMLEAIAEELLESSDAGLDERVRSLETQRRRIEAELAMTLGEVNRRRSYLDDGHRTLQAYLRATCNWSDAEAARVNRLQVAVADVPGLAEALHDGRIGAPQANELAVAHGNRRVRERLIEFAPLLLDQAERLSFREFRLCVQRFVMLADVDGADRDRAASVAQRRASVTNLDGSLHLEGSGGDPLVNVELQAIFRHFCDLEFEDDLAARKAEFGDSAEELPLPRTAAQRGYDAFVAIMRGAMANDAAGRGPKHAELCVDILMDHRSWAQLLANAGLAPEENLSAEEVDPFTGVASPTDLLDDLLDARDSVAGRRCETADGQVLDPHTVLRAALAGHLRRVVLGADDVPIDMGRRARVFVGSAREAAMMLALQCDHPGCGLPADWCQVDHSTEWGEGGTTDQANAGVECGGHNRLKHRKRWRTKRDVHGRVHTIRPDGTIMLPVGAGPPCFADLPEIGPVGEPPAPSSSVAVTASGASADAPPTAEQAPTAAAATASTPTGPTTSAPATAASADVATRLDDWTRRAGTDVERRCRGLRAVAIRHVIAHGDEVDLTSVVGSG